MPTRLVREGILTSKRVAALPDWGSEVFYRRLLSIVDDFGRYFGDPILLISGCYPRQIDKVSPENVAEWTRNCKKAGLIQVYESGGEAYIQVLDFRQKIRAQSSRYPDPPENDQQTHSNRKQSPEHDHLDVCGDEDGDVLDPDSGESGSSKPKADPPNTYRTKKGRKLTGEQFAWFHQFWRVFNKKDGKAEAADAWHDLKVDEGMLQDILYGAEQEAEYRVAQVARGDTPKWAQGWLSGRRWEKWCELRDDKNEVESREKPLHAMGLSDLEALCKELGIERQRINEDWPEFEMRIREAQRG